MSSIYVLAGVAILLAALQFTRAVTRKPEEKGQKPPGQRLLLTLIYLGAVVGVFWWVMSRIPDL